MGDHMASEIILIKVKHLSRAFVSYDIFLFMSTKHTFLHVLIFDVFWYHLKRMLLVSL